jgi:hypothetical protein
MSNRPTLFLTARCSSRWFSNQFCRFQLIAVFSLLAFLRKPVRALPSRDLAEHRATRLEMLVQRRAADAARGSHLAIREMIGVEKAKRLGDPRSFR